ncbi:MAG: hypothetical protein JNL11_01555 [Bdellovibrionaceae bacterium]|nr:hypothetical protein [Pseudobdellovibrionaceae bacterium]
MSQAFSMILDYIYGEYAIYKFIATIIVIAVLLFYFRRHVFKIMSAVSLSILLFILLFPKNELSDFISRTVYQQTGNQHKLDFDDMSFSWAGGLAIQLDRVYFQARGFPPLTLKELIASPDIMSAINHKPYGRVKVTGLFNGNAEISVGKYRPDGDSDGKEDQSLISLSANRLDISNLKSFLNLPFDLNGNAELSAKIISDFNNTPPPTGGSGLPLQIVGVPEMSLTIKNFDMPPFMLERGLPMPVNVPGLKFSEIVFKGRLYGNTFQIEELQLGKPGDELAGRIKGNISLTKTPIPQIEKYDITTDLQFRQSFHDKISLYLSMFSANLIKPLASGGYELKAKISGTPYGLPQFNPAR